MKHFSLQIGLLLLVSAFSLVIIAFILPYNPDGYLRAFDSKKSMLRDDNRDSAIILMGGSNVAFGFNSPFLEEETKMPVINAGLHAGSGIKFMVEEIFPLLKKGDILVFSPEYGTLLSNPEGKDFTALVYLGNMDYAKKMNRVQWSAFIQNTAGYIRSKIEYAIIYTLLHKKNTTVYQCASFNSHGDVVAHYKLSHPLLYIGKKKEASKMPDDKFFSWFFNALQELSDQGIQIVMLPPALAQTAYENQKDNIHIIDSMLRESRFPFACPPSVMSYPDSLFYDTYYHLDSLGAAIHSAELARLLKELNISPS